jgi:hypothetical protein
VVEPITKKAQALKRRHDELAELRRPYEAYWSQIAAFVIPRLDDLFGMKKSPGENREGRLYDSTAPLALERFAAAVESILTPRTSRWHSLRSSDRSLMRKQRVGAWYEDVTQALFDERYSNHANYASNQHECYLSLGSLGTSVLFTDDYDTNLRYKSLPLGQCYMAENHQGIVDTLHREFPYTARQLRQRFGAENLNEKTLKILEQTPEKEITVIHATLPTEDYNAKVPGKNMPFRCVYMLKDDSFIVEESGYLKFPYSIGRYVTAPGEIYGRSPAMLVLSDVKMLNSMSKSMIRQIHRITEPPLLVSDDGVLTKVQLQPNAINVGGLSGDGTELVKPMRSGSMIEIGLDHMEQRRKTVNDAFLVTLFQILVETPRMTATEVMERAQEKGALLAPTMGRQQSEALGPMVERELSLLSYHRKLPPPPPEIREAGFSYTMVYESPLARAMRAEEAVGFLRTVDAITPLAQANPSILDRIDGDETLLILAEINGMPRRMLRSDEGVEAIRKQRAQQQAVQAATEAAPGLAQAVESSAKAGQIRSESGPDAALGQAVRQMRQALKG